MRCDVQGARQKNKEVGKLIRDAAAWVACLEKECVPSKLLKSSRLIAEKQEATVLAYEECIRSRDKDLAREKRKRQKEDVGCARSTCSDSETKLDESKYLARIEATLSKVREQRKKVREDAAAAKDRLNKAWQDLDIARRDLRAARGRLRERQAYMNKAAAKGERKHKSNRDTVDADTVVEEGISECGVSGSTANAQSPGTRSRSLDPSPKILPLEAITLESDKLQQGLVDFHRHASEFHNSLKEDVAATRRAVAAWKSEDEARHELQDDVVLKIKMMRSERRKAERVAETLRIERERAQSPDLSSGILGV